MVVIIPPLFFQQCFESFLSFSYPLQAICTYLDVPANQNQIQTSYTGLNLE